jgi:hypothetical protein
MAYGLPVITTHVGAQGIPTGPEAGVLVAESDEEFTRLVTEIVIDHTRWTKLTASARRTADLLFGGSALLTATRLIAGDRAEGPPAIDHPKGEVLDSSR